MQYETDKQPGKERLLISKQKALNFNTTNNFCVEDFFQDNSSNFLFLYKPGYKPNK